MTRFSVGLVASLVWLGALAFSISTYTVFNDHFDRISRARQIARYGALPFQGLLRSGLFHDGVQLRRTPVPAWRQPARRDAAQHRIHRQRCHGRVPALATDLELDPRGSSAPPFSALLSMPRAYDFDKVLFYPLGIALCWHYIDRPSARRAVALGAGIAIGALFRYDTGVYIGCGAVVAAMVLHWREPRSACATDRPLRGNGRAALARGAASHRRVRQCPGRHRPDRDLRSEGEGEDRDQPGAALFARRPGRTCIDPAAGGFDRRQMVGGRQRGRPPRSRVEVWPSCPEPTGTRRMKKRGITR